MRRNRNDFILFERRIEEWKQVGLIFLLVNIAYFIIFYFTDKEYISIFTYIMFTGMFTEIPVKIFTGANRNAGPSVAIKYIVIALSYFFIRGFLNKTFGINLPM